MTNVNLGNEKDTERGRRTLSSVILVREMKLKAQRSIIFFNTTLHDR